MARRAWLSEGGRRWTVALAALVIAGAAAAVFVGASGFAGAATLTAIDPGDGADPVMIIDSAADVTTAMGSDGDAVEATRPEIAVDGVLSWAYLHRATMEIVTSADATHHQSTESMIKAWLSADELAQAQARGAQPNLDLISQSIRDSDDGAAEALYWKNGGDATVRRLIDTCHLTDTTIVSGWWSLTTMSAVDAVRMGACIADGTAAGPQWTEWLLDEMRQVRGEGRFGIIDAVDADSAARMAIKNGWTWHDDGWHVNCLAIAPSWVLAVMMTYPGGHGLGYGADLCARVAAGVLGPKVVNAAGDS
jgi:hypothetical protein